MLNEGNLFVVFRSMKEASKLVVSSCETQGELF